MQFLSFADKTRYKSLSSEELRQSFVVDNLFAPGETVLCYTEADRGIVGSVVPTAQPLGLPLHKELASAYFTERREIGVINVGAPGRIEVDGISYDLGHRDSLYIGRGSKDIAFHSTDAADPARFFLTSYPAHKAYPTTPLPKAAARRVELGSLETSNERVIYQTICPGRVQTCQLVMGFTELAEGSVWNTMPPHTHKRRTEIYAYFGLDEDTRVFHFMGEPNELRTVVLKEGDVVVSPSWSIHSGAGTRNYFFVWSMGGENQEFDDMDGLALADLR